NASPTMKAEASCGWVVKTKALDRPPGPGSAARVPTSGITAPFGHSSWPTPFSLNVKVGAETVAFDAVVVNRSAAATAPMKVVNFFIIVWWLKRLPEGHTLFTKLLTNLRDEVPKNFSAIVS